jgi:hypothetical protein
MKLARSIRIDPRSGEYLDRTLGKPGEILFDKDTGSIRCFDGEVEGGIELARADLLNVSPEKFADATESLGLVSTSLSYADPSWITSLAATKITGRITNAVYIGDAAVVTNAMLANRTIRFGTTTVNLGSNSNSIAGLSSVTATTFTGSLTGNAATATRLQTARTINGVPFDGTQNIVIGAEGEVIVSVDANELTGTTIASNVVNSSLTSVGTLTTLAVTGSISGSSTISATGTISTTSNVTATGSVSATSISASNNITATNTVSSSGTITAVGNVTTGSFFVSSRTPTDKNHVTNKKYVDVRSIAMSVALS